MSVSVKKRLALTSVLFVLLAPRMPAQASAENRLAELKSQAYQLAEKAITAPPPATNGTALMGNVWCADAGSTLKAALQQWQKTAHWSTQWQSEYDYPMLARICFQGSFEQALQGIINAYREAENPLYLTIYPKQRLAVISDS